MYTKNINLPYDTKISKVKTILRYAQKAELRKGSDTTDASKTSRRNEVIPNQPLLWNNTQYWDRLPSTMHG